MKKAFKGKDTLIRHEGELADHFRQLLAEDSHVRWHVEPQAGPQQSDRVELEFDGHRVLYHAVYELRPSPARLAVLKSTYPPPLLLVTPELSERLVDGCRAQGLAAMDLNGRTWLRGPGLLIDRPARPGRSFRYELEPKNIFEGKSARILRSLLTDRDRPWTQAELLTRTRASGGLVSRIVSYLITQGYLEKTAAREFRVSDPAGLVKAWMAADQPERRCRATAYQIEGVEPSELAQRLHDFYVRRPDQEASSGAVVVRSAIEAVQRSLVPFKGSCPPILFTQWTAAALRCDALRNPGVTSAYVSYLPTARQMEVLGLTPSTNGGNVWLLLPGDEGVFLESQRVQDLPLTTDAQICLDLHHAERGGAEAASTLCQWDGFCRA